MDWAPRIVELPDGRRVGYRRAGTGPAVALLHASPRSSAVLVPLGEALADRFTVFAFDTPGFGWSDALRIDRPDAADFGAALVATFDALGIASAAVYGSHTGAAVAVAAAIAHPQRVSALALDGYAIFTPAEQAEALANYLMPIRPHWDGSHLAALWSRVKDQFSFFPWYLRADAGRLPRAMLPTALLQDVVVDFLAAGDAYRAAYAAAFRYPGKAVLGDLQIPTTIMARDDDLLFGHLDRLGDLPAMVTRQALGPDRAAWAEAVASALARGQAGTAPPLPGSAHQAVVRVHGGTIAITRMGGAAGRPIVLLPGIPGSAAASSGLARALATARPVVCVDLPGFGASALSSAGLTAIVQAVREALALHDVTAADVVACEESGAIGCALAQDWPDACIVLLHPVPDQDRVALAGAMVDATPGIDGAHLLAAWHQLRDRALWRPWFQRDPEHALPAGTDPDVTRLQAVLADWMHGGTQGRAVLEAVLAPPLAPPLAALGRRAAIVAQDGHPWAADMRALAAASGAGFAVTAGAEERASAGPILSLLAQAR